MRLANSAKISQSCLFFFFVASVSEPFSQWAFLRVACSVVVVETGPWRQTQVGAPVHILNSWNTLPPPLHIPTVTPSEKPFPDICSWPFHTPLFIRLPWVFLPSSCYSTITCCRACLDSVHTMLSVTQPWGHMHYPTHEVLIPIIEPNTPKNIWWIKECDLF